MPKLSFRLKSILEIIEPRENFYDVCCDHGDLGIAAAQANLAKNVIFIDQVESIMESLKLKLKATDIPSGITTTTICKDARNFQLSLKNSNFVIAGIGENTAISILEQINLCQNSEIILSIHSDNFLLREYLIQRGLKTTYEVALKDNKKFYELIKVSKSKGVPTTKVGNMLWEPKNPASKSLLLNRIEHLETKVRYRNNKKDKIILNSLKEKLKLFS